MLKTFLTTVAAASLLAIANTADAGELKLGHSTWVGYGPFYVARDKGFFKDEDGSLLEGTASNLFIVEGGALVTPPLSQGILPGTSRAVVLLLAREAGREVREERVDEARLRAADEVFVTSSTIRLAPVVAFEGEPVGGGALGPVARDLQARFEAHIDGLVAAERAAARA